MSGVAAAIAGSAVIGYVGSKASGDAQAKSAREGIKAEQQMSAENLAFQREMAESQREDFAPWQEAGGQALSKLWSGVQSGEFEVGNVDVKKDPGYQFRMDEGVEALDKSAAARGRLLSGAQNKAITGYSQNLASQEYGAAYAREANEKKDKYNMLAGISQQGQASAARQAGATSQLAQTGGNIMAQSGQAQNAAYQNMGAARAGAYQGQATAVNQAAQNWMMYKALG